jgi:hypothetical protein
MPTPCSAERAAFLLVEKMGKQKAGKLVEQALAKGGSFIEALGQLEKELPTRPRCSGDWLITDVWRCNETACQAVARSAILKTTG